MPAVNDMLVIASCDSQNRKGFPSFRTRPNANITKLEGTVLTLMTVCFCWKQGYRGENLQLRHAVGEPRQTNVPTLVRVTLHNFAHS